MRLRRKTEVPSGESAETYTKAGSRVNGGARYGGARGRTDFEGRSGKGRRAAADAVNVGGPNVNLNRPSYGSFDSMILHNSGLKITVFLMFFLVVSASALVIANQDELAAVDPGEVGYEFGGTGEVLHGLKYVVLTKATEDDGSSGLKGGTARVTGFHNDASDSERADLYIPGTVYIYVSGVKNTYTVTQIGKPGSDGPFRSKTFSTLTLNEGLEYIAQRCFQRSTFTGTNLEVILPSTLNSLGLFPFDITTGIKKMIIRTDMEFNFRDLKGLRDINEFELQDAQGNVILYNTHYSTANSALLSRDGTELWYAPTGLSGEFQIPSTVTTIKGGSFQYALCNTVIIPEGVTTIRASAFANASTTQYVFLGHDTITLEEEPGSGVTSGYVWGRGNSVGAYSATFCGDTNVINSAWASPWLYTGFTVTYMDVGGLLGENVYWSYNNSVLNISGSGSMYTDQRYTPTVHPAFFTYADDITSVVIGSDVTSICQYVFYGLENISTAVVGSDVTSIEVGAFGNCKGLGTLTVPSNLNYTNNGFAGCTALSLIKFTGTSAVSPALTTKNGNAPWYASTTELTISSPTNMAFGDYMFKDCSALVTLTVSSGTVGAHAFDGCSGLRELTIGSSVTSIGDAAFGTLTSCTTISIPIGWTDTSMFTSLPSLVTVVVTGSGASPTYTYLSSGESGTYRYTPWFVARSNINDVTLSTSITSIGEYMFCGCTNLPSMTLNSSIDSIGTHAFDGCTGLVTITILDDTYYPEVGELAFETGRATYLDARLDIVSTYTHTYSGTPETFDNWPAYLVMAVDHSSTQHGAHAYTTGGATTITVRHIDVDYQIGAALYCTVSGDTITFRGSGAMYSLSAEGVIQDSAKDTTVSWFSNPGVITSVYLPAGVTSIGAYMFKGTGIQTIDIPVTVTSIGASAFEDCSSLECLDVPKVTSVGVNALKGCSSLKWIRINYNVSAGNNCFSGCDGSYVYAAGMKSGDTISSTLKIQAAKMKVVCLQGIESKFFVSGTVACVIDTLFRDITSGSWITSMADGGMYGSYTGVPTSEDNVYTASTSSTMSFGS